MREGEGISWLRAMNELLDINQLQVLKSEARVYMYKKLCLFICVFVFALFIALIKM